MKKKLLLFLCSRSFLFIHSFITSAMQQGTMKDTNMQYALTGGAAARELELQKSLQQLLNRYNKTGTPGSSTV